MVAAHTPYGNIQSEQEAPRYDSIGMDAKFSNAKGLQILRQRISPNAMDDYRSDPPRGYHHDTRDEVLQDISSWIDHPCQNSQVLWLYGNAGAGKSSLAQTITEICRTSKRMGGSFFFRRGMKGRDQGSYLFSTIAYQLAMNIPDLRKPINNAVCRDRILPSKSVEDQFQSLIVRPIQDFIPTPSSTLIFIIDGLDECDGHDTQRLILQCIADAVTKFKLPIQFLVTSRPEPHIRRVFDNDILNNITHRIPLPSFFHSSSVESSLIYPRADHDLHALRVPKWRRLAKKRPLHFSSYPQIVTLQQSNGKAESYSRSLLLMGHGFPIWHPAGDLAKPIDYLKKGVSIGDVGVLDKDGIFDFCFNIFLPPDDPVHARSAPREFQPIKPSLQPSEIKYHEEYFTPGHIMTSKGVLVERNPDSLLDISFSSREQEGGILILPNGASREDLVSTTRFHEYAKRNAPHWYQVINGYGGVVHTNGSLFLVTGCDKAKDWAVASFPNHPGDTETCLDLRYTWQPEYSPPWSDSGTALTKFYAPPSSKSIPSYRNGKNQCVFVRGLRISLTEPSWGKTLPHLDSSRLYYSYILNTPSKFRLGFDAVLVFLHLRLSERHAVKKLTASRLQLFHPNFIIGQVLLAEYPYAEVALVDDSVWCSLVGGGSCTLSEVNEVVTKVFSLNKVVEKDGVITLIPKTIEDLENAYDRPTTLGNFSRSFQFLFRGRGHTKNQPTRWVKDISVAEHAKLF